MTEDKKINLKKKVKELEHKIKQLEEVTVGKSIIKNIWTWITILIAIYCITPNQYGKGILTYFILFFSSYYLHIESHKVDTIFTVLHRYHHDHTNLFSNLIQYSLELSIPTIFLIIYYISGTILLDKWIILFSTLFYSTIHNINYGYLHVNNVHTLHHEHVMTNIGPDLCDIIFGTKHPDDTIENTNHYIPNVIIITIGILWLKHMCLYEPFNTLFFKYGCYFLLSCFLCCLFSSIFLFYR
uniref:Fatty acid hydroxylase domain-containing protein n=1 Tax=viral metagenome TaxID=1070528 RepID=A0A6C0B9N3_9ZZZZ